MKIRNTLIKIVMLMLLSGTTACASASRPAMKPSFQQPIAGAAQAQPKVLTENHFKSDRTGNLTEQQLDEILESPVFLEEDTRLGIVPVATAYELDEELPLTAVPHQLSNALEKTGFFEVTSEVSTDWPTDRSIAGLRELAARYRAKYLLLYRHRFEERSRVNGWGWTYPTIIGLFTAPGKTVEVAGVMEATLFDPRTGTILFTAFQRVHEQTHMNIWHNKHKRQEIEQKLLEKGTKQLADEVTHKVHRLVAARPEPKSSASALLQN